MIVFPGVAADASKVVAALDAFYPQVTWVNDITSPPTTGEALPEWGVATATPFVPPKNTASLGAAAQLANVDPQQLIPGAFAAFARLDGAPYGLPVGVEPLAVAYSPPAFQAAGLPSPAADWTLADFRAAAAALAGAAQAGRLPKPVTLVLPPLAGRTATPMQGGGKLLWYGALSDPRLWAAFSLGFGGSVVSQGRFDLTGLKTADGIGALIQLARQFGGGQDTLPQTQAAVQGLNGTAAMFFTSYPPRPGLPAGYRVARFPRLPVRAVVPAAPSGVGLALTADRFSSWETDYNTGAPQWALEATVAYARWTYTVDRRPDELPGLVSQPPPLADAAVQTAYWSGPARAADGSTAVGDWRNMEVVEAGWPLTGPGGQGAVFLSNTANIVLTELTKAVFDAVPVSTALATITQQLNAAATQYAASAGG